MAKLPEYQNLNEKKTYFSQTVIETEEEFDNFYNSIQNNGQIWRGSNEAKYKIFTSLQRFWIQNEKKDSIIEVKEHLSKVFDHFKKWNNFTLKRYLMNLGIQPSEYSLFSILRHYSIPMPFLDWTESIKVGLFFMIEEEPNNNSFKNKLASFFSKYLKKNIEINNYFSLYELSPNHPLIKFDLKALLKTTNEDPKSRFIEPKDQNPKVESHEPINAFLSSSYGFEHNLNLDYIALVQDKPEEKVKYFLKNNLNISNQEGLFLFNSAPKKSIEEFLYDKYFKEFKNKGISQSELNKMYLENNKKHFNCYDINKTLCSYIRKKIETGGITKNYIYPDLNTMREAFYNNFE